MEPLPNTDSGLSVFLAEDDEGLRSLIADILRRDGHRVIESADGNSMLGTLIRRGLAGEPDHAVVICDIHMPGCDGLTLLRSMREHDGGAPAFVFMTAFADNATLLEAYALGALSVLAKPFELDDLRALVRAHADRITAS